MNLKTFALLIGFLTFSLHVKATELVLQSVGSPLVEVCDADWNRCYTTGGEAPGYVVVNTAEEIKALAGNLVEQFKSDNKVLRNLIEQRETDIRMLSDKADLADQHIARLEKALYELTNKSPENKRGLVSRSKPR